MRRIPLTQGQFALVDDEDFKTIAAYNWFAKWNRGTQSFYAYRSDYSRGPIAITVRMHRLIAGATGDGRSQHVDHRNKDTLDNRRANLRICSVTQNGGNSKKRSDGVTSAFKGVGRYKSRCLWVARIQISGKRRCLGYFAEEAGAARAYDAAALQHFGEFACTNQMLGLLAA